MCNGLPINQVRIDNLRNMCKRSKRIDARIRDSLLAMIDAVENKYECPITLVMIEEPVCVSEGAIPGANRTYCCRSNLIEHFETQRSANQTLTNPITGEKWGPGSADILAVDEDMRTEIESTIARLEKKIKQALAHRKLSDNSIFEPRDGDSNYGAMKCDAGDVGVAGGLSHSSNSRCLIL